MKNNLVYAGLSYKITGLLFEVHNELGIYCNEKQYADLFEAKLRENNYKHEREKILPESFQGEKFGRNRIDFIIEDKVVIEFKYKRVINKQDFYQLMRYLVALNKKLGFIVNFRAKYLTPKRVLNPQCKN